MTTCSGNETVRQETLTAAPREPVMSTLVFQARKIFGFDFFISYGRRDGTAYARELHRLLELRGFLTFIDRREVHPGGVLDQSITAGLERSRRFVYIDTPAARASPFVRREIELALQTPGKRIIQLRDPNGGSPFLENGRFVAVDESIESIATGLPSAAALAGVISGAAAVRNRTRIWVALVATALIITALSYGRAREALATYVLGLAYRYQSSDSASIQDLVQVSRAASLLRTTQPFRDALDLAEHVVMKRRALIPLEAWTTSGPVRYGAISQVQPPALLVVVGTTLLKISTTLSRPQTPATQGAVLLFDLMKRMIFGIPAETDFRIDVLRSDIDAGAGPDDGTDPPVTGTLDGSHIAFLVKGIPVVFANRVSSPCHALPANEKPIALAISRDTQTLVARTTVPASDGAGTERVRWWNTSRCDEPPQALDVRAQFDRAGECTHVPEQWRTQVRVSDDGRFVAVPDARGVQMLDTHTRTQRTGTFADGNAVCTGAFIADNRFAAATATQVAVFAFDGAGEKWTEEPGGQPLDQVVGIASVEPGTGFTTVAASWSESLKFWTRSNDGGWGAVDVDRSFAHAERAAVVAEGRVVVAWSQHDRWDVVPLSGPPPASNVVAGTVLDPSPSDDALSLSGAGPWVLKQTPTSSILFERRAVEAPVPANASR